ncbi:MAG: PcfK-like family protein [Allomuricauda sp.]
MNTTDTFKDVIQNHLRMYGQQNPTFKEKLSSDKKNIDDCVKYILGEVKKSGCTGFADQDVFDMAYFYYEHDVEVPKGSTGKVVVNHVGEDNPKYRAYKITKSEEIYLRNQIKEEPNKELLESFKKDLDNLLKKPLEYWKTLDLDGYKNDPDPDSQERYGEIKFMLEYHKPKTYNKPNSKEKAKTKAPKKPTQRKSNRTTKKKEDVKVDKVGQTSLF